MLNIYLIKKDTTIYDQNFAKDNRVKTHLYIL